MPSIVLDLPPQLNSLRAPLLSFLHLLLDFLDAQKTGKSLDFVQVETKVAEATAELARGGEQLLLQSLDLDRERVLIGGVLHRKVGQAQATYYGLSGPRQVTHTLYRPLGDNRAKTVDPVSLRAGVVGAGWLPATAEAMAFLLQQGTAREAAKAAAKLFRLPYSVGSFEDVGHAVGALVVASQADVEEELIEHYEVPANAHSISVSVDRVSIPMEEELPKPWPTQVRSRKKKAPKRRVARNFRMAYCGTVTLHDKEGKALHTLRYGRMPQGDALEMCEGMAGDVRVLLRKHPGLLVTALCDGAPEMWNLLEEAGLTQKELGVVVHRRVDFWHLLEKLGKAARLLDEESAAARLLRWKLRLLNQEEAAKEIHAELAASDKEWVREGKNQPVHEALTFLENQKERLSYAAGRKLGLPIGSGNVEATCKSLFEVRLKRSGARWHEETGNHVVQLRALALSDRWDDALALTLRPLRRAVRAAA